MARNAQEQDVPDLDDAEVLTLFGPGLLGDLIRIAGVRAC